MSLASVQLALSTVEQAALVKGTSAGQFGNIKGTLQDPLPVQITNMDAAIIIYVGGVGVTSATGTPIYPKGSWTANLYGESEIPHIVAGSGTPTAAVLCGRQ